MKEKKTIMGRADVSDIIQLVCVLICLFFVFSPYSFYKNAGDKLASDGNMERVTPQLVNALRIVFIFAAVLFTGLVIWKLINAESRREFFSSILSFPKSCYHDIKPFGKDLWSAIKPEKSMYYFLFLILFLAGIIIRWLRINAPLMHDEAYSIAVWGRSDLMFAIRDYHLPNNHVFHSVLINLIYHHIGKSAALFRLPVFISGCLLIPAVWLLGRLFYNDFIGIAAAGLTAFAPYLIFYSVNARGYEIQALLSVLTFGLAVYAKRKKNAFAWVLLILFSALNFFTLPVALYPFGGICVWLLLSVLFSGFDGTLWRSRWQLLKYLIFMGLSVSILSILLYVPLLLYSGLDSFFGNVFIGGTEASTFGQTMISRLEDNVRAFTNTWSVPVILFVAAGIVLSPVFFRKNAREKVSFASAIAVWMGLLIPFQRPNLWPRTLLFLHPFILLFAASGLCGLRSIPHVRKEVSLACAVLILAAGVSQVVLPEGKGPDERAVQIILEREGSNAANIHFVTAAQDDAPIWVYADLYDLPRKIFDKRESFNTVYAFVNPLNDTDLGSTTLIDLLSRFGPGEIFFDLDSEEILLNEPNAVLYRFEGKENTIRKAYGEYPEIQK